MEHKINDLEMFCRGGCPRQANWNAGRKCHLWVVQYNQYEL